MPYATLVANNVSYPIVELSVTETAMRGYEWSARLVGTPESLNNFSPNNVVTIMLYDDSSHYMEFPPMITLQGSTDPNGVFDVSGMDQTTWKLSKDVNPDNENDTTSVYNSSTTHSMSAIVSEICSKCGVQLQFSGSSVTMYGLGTLTGTGVSLLDRVLGLFNHEWRVANDGTVLVQPLVWDSANNATSLPMLSAQRNRDYEQRKTSMGFSKILSLPGGSDVTVQNGSSTTTINAPLPNPRATGGYPANNWINPYTMERCMLYCQTATVLYDQAMALGGNYLQCDLLSQNDADNNWKVKLYHGDPGPDDPGNAYFVGEVSGSGLSATVTTTSAHPITHARLYRTITYQTQSGTGTSETTTEYPHSDGIKAVLRCWDTIPNAAQSFTYQYNTGNTPANPDPNVVSDVLWSSLAQCQSLAPGQMWADNRQSHTINYSGPWVLGLHVRDCISHHVFPTARIDQITYSISCNNCHVDMQCAVLGSNQW